MKFSRILGILLRQLYLVRGSFTRLFPIVIWVSVDIILWGFITRYLSSVSKLEFNIVTILLGGVLLWDFSTRIIHGFTTSFLEDVWARNFLNTFASPLRIPEYLLGLTLASTVTSLLALVIMLVLASVCFGLSLVQYGMFLFFYVGILFLYGIAIGIFGSSLVIRLGPASEWFVWPLPALLSPFVGVFYPLSTLPEWMRIIAKTIPPSYVFENMRSLMSGASVSGEDLVLGVLLALGWLVLACGFYARSYRAVVRSGLLARYTAESVN